jgi:hypothetical protein
VQEFLDPLPRLFLLLELDQEVELVLLDLESLKELM